MSDTDVRNAAEAAGWEIIRVSLYDEEGVEGWRWIAPNGTEYGELGSWDEPAAVPDEVREMFEEHHD